MEELAPGHFRKNVGFDVINIHLSEKQKVSQKLQWLVLDDVNSMQFGKNKMTIGCVIDDTITLIQWCWNNRKQCYQHKRRFELTIVNPSTSDDDFITKMLILDVQNSNRIEKQIDNKKQLANEFHNLNIYVCS